jgi:ornithine cyclodeaminase
MQVFDKEALAASLPYHHLIRALEDAFRSDIAVPERVHHQVHVPGCPEATLLLMPAWRSGRFIGVKIATVFPGNTAMSLPTVNASYLLLDANTGESVAIMDGVELTLRRTAAASALASRYLSRKDSTRLLMVGTGKLAPHLIAAHATVRRFDEVMIWGRRPAAARQLASDLGPWPCEVAVVEDLERAARRADIICCATLATEPLIKGDWLRAGQHLDLVGAFRPDMSEADGDALARADVYVDTFAGALSGAGEIMQAIDMGTIERSHIVGDLFALARDICRRRESNDAITLFKSVGTALEDLAAAELAIG